MAELNIYGPIGYEETDTEGMTAGGFAKILSTVDASDPLTININSPGGSVFDGLTIYQSLVERPGENNIVIQGVAASIASVIAMAGDRITMAQSSRFMIHNPMGPSAIAFGTSDDLREAADDTIKTADLLDSVRDTLADVYAARSGTERETILDWMQGEKWLTAAEARKAGFADDVRPNKTLAATHSRAPMAKAMGDLDELIATAELCERISVRNRKLPSPERLRLARAKLALTTLD